LLKERLDKLLVKKGFFKTREMAKKAIMEGVVFVDSKKVDKPGAKVNLDAEIKIIKKMPYVSRGGLKLEEALEVFSISVKEKVAVDIGASTGGFTDCLLQKGAKKVYAIDVGKGQLHWKLRNDKRVILFEGENIRYFDTRKIPEKVDLVTIDVSFISLKKVLPKAKEFLKEDGLIIALVKPQFEAGRKFVKRGGVVKDLNVHKEVLKDIVSFSLKEKLFPISLFPSSIRGAKSKNIEYFILLSLKEEEIIKDEDIEKIIKKLK